METRSENERASLTVVTGCLGTAGLFEALTVLATQDRSVRAASPWRDDPYDAVVSLAQFTVPMLALVIALRLPVWRAPGSPDRARQTLRAAGAAIVLIGLTAVFEGAATVGGAHGRRWGGWTSFLVVGLGVVCALTAAMALVLVRARPRGGSPGPWRHDWLGDVVLICQRVRLARRWATPTVVEWVRRRAMTVFGTLSVLAAFGVIGALAVGERWTNPFLIAWAVVVETTSNLAFCVLSNALAGFIARPARSPSRRAVEVAAIAGCVAIQIATAFRAALWSVVGSGPLTDVAALAAVTLGSGLVVSLLTAGLLFSRQPTSSPEGA